MSGQARPTVLERVLMAAPVLLAAWLSVRCLRVERWAGDTGLYSAIALKTLEGGHWWTLHSSFDPYFNKPPLAIWAHALSMAVFGKGTLGLYLPEIVAYVLTILIVQWTASRLSNRVTGAIAGLILASTGQFLALVDMVKPDYLHNMFMLMGVGMVVVGASGGGARWPLVAGGNGERPERRFTRGNALIVLSGVPMGLAMMVKPLWALLAYGAVILYLAINPRRAPGGAHTHARLGGVFHEEHERWRTVGLVPLGALVSLVVAAPWHVSMSLIHGEAFWHQYFVKQSYNRVIAGKFLRIDWYWYFNYMWATTWPLFAGMIAGLVSLGVFAFLRPHLAKRRRTHAQCSKCGYPIEGLAMCPECGWPVPSNRPERPAHSSLSFRPAGALLLGLVWCVFWLAILSLVPDKRRNFSLHVYPGLSMIAAALVTWWWPLVRERVGLRSVLTVLALAAPVLTLAFSIPNPVKRYSTPILNEAALWVPTIDYLKTVDEPVYAGGIYYADAGRLYVRSGVWPLGRGWSNKPFEVVPPGALVIHDTKRGKIDPALERVFEARAGKRRIVVVRTPADRETASDPALTEESPRD